MWETQVQSLGQEDPLEKSIETHSSILAWRIPWTEEPGGLQSIGLQRVRHTWIDLAKNSNYTLGWPKSWFGFFHHIFLFGQPNAMFNTLLWVLPSPPAPPPGSASEGVCVCVTQSSPTLGSTWTVAHQAPPSMGILQARILEWVAMSSSRGSSRPRNHTQVSHTAGIFFTVGATWEAHLWRRVAR